MVGVLFAFLTRVAAGSQTLPQTRRMLHDLAAVWVSLQEAEAGPKVDDMGQSLMRHSRLYRASLGAHIAQLDACAKSRSDSEHVAAGSLPAEQAREYEKQRARVAEYHVVWYLCEILYLATTEDESVTAHLLDWMHMTFYPDFSLIRRIESRAVEVDAAVKSQLYALLQSFLLQGCLREASLCLGILAHHEPVEGKYLQVIAALLLEMPLVGAATSLREFMPRFQLWRAKCGHLQQAADMDACPQSVRLLAMMDGDEKVLQASGCSWLELVLAHLLFVDPGQKRSHLPQLVQRCVVVWRGLSVADLPAYQRILHAVFCDNVVLALKVASAFTQAWFPAHLADLLHHAQVLPPDEEGEGRVALLLAHADDVPLQLWPTAVQYLRRLDSRAARLRIEALLRRVAPTCEREQRALYDTALEGGLSECAAWLGQAWALRLWQDEQWRDAMDWAAEAGREALVAQMVFAVAQTPQGLDGVSQVQGGAASVPALAFVEAYGRLKRARAGGQHGEAATCLMELVGERRAPRQYWTALLQLCVPLFEEPAALWTREQLRTLLARLESVASNIAPAAQADLQVLQLALVRCCSRALVAPQ